MLFFCRCIHQRISPFLEPKNSLLSGDSKDLSQYEYHYTVPRIRTYMTVLLQVLSRSVVKKCEKRLLRERSYQRGKPPRASTTQVRAHTTHKTNPHNTAQNRKTQESV